MSATHPDTTDRTPTSWLTRAAQLFGVVFLLVGVLGFIPGITTNYDELSFASHDSGAELLGIFQVSVLHNIVHLLFGIAGLAMARRVSTALTYFLGAGAIYAVLWLYGLLIDKSSDANFVPLNTADDWLHFVLAAAMLAIGLAGRKELRRTTGTDRA